MSKCNCEIPEDCNCSEYDVYDFEQYLHDLLMELYDQIKHGDEEHQKWLKDKIIDFAKQKGFC